MKSTKSNYTKFFALCSVFLTVSLILSLSCTAASYSGTLKLSKKTGQTGYLEKTGYAYTGYYENKSNIGNYLIPVSKTAIKKTFKIINTGIRNRYISLKQALKLALANYPGILSGKYNYLNYVYLNNESTYKYYPQISANAGFTKETVMNVNNKGEAQTIGNQVLIQNVNQNYFVNNYSGSINATLELYSFGSRYYNYLQSKYNMLSQKYAYNLTINNDLYNVVFDFESYFEAQQLEQADRENLKNDEIQYKSAYAFYKVGTGDLLDAETAKATMETAKASYINSTFNVKIAKLALKEG